VGPEELVAAAAAIDVTIGGSGAIQATMSPHRHRPSPVSDVARDRLDERRHRSLWAAEDTDVASEDLAQARATRRELVPDPRYVLRLGFPLVRGTTTAAELSNGIVEGLPPGRVSEERRAAVRRDEIDRKVGLGGVRHVPARDQRRRELVNGSSPWDGLGRHFAEDRGLLVGMGVEPEKAQERFTPLDGDLRAVPIHDPVRRKPPGVGAGV
jgi:hypothetical protein